MSMNKTTWNNSNVDLSYSTAGVCKYGCWRQGLCTHTKALSLKQILGETLPSITLIKSQRFLFIYKQGHW